MSFFCSGLFTIWSEILLSAAPIAGTHQTTSTGQKSTKSDGENKQDMMYSTASNYM